MATDKCIKCGSYAFNLYKEDIDQGGLCDVHYWQYRAHRAEALAEQPAQQQEQLREENERLHVENRRLIDRIETIGVSVGVGGIATTTAQRTWVGLTDEDIGRCFDAGDGTIGGLIAAIEAKLREKNT